MGYVRLGKILKPFGLKGEVRCFSLTDFPKLRFKKGNTVSLFNESLGTRFDATVTSFRDSGNNFFLGLSDLHSIEDAEQVLGCFVEMKEEEAPVPEGFVRLQDLLGCKVYSTENEEVGEVVSIQQYSPSKNLVVKKKTGGTFAIPFVSAFIKELDIENKKIVAEIIGGML